MRLLNGGEAHAHRHGVLVDSGRHLRLNILVLLTHKAGARLLSLLDKPLLFDHLLDLFLLHFHNNVLAGLLVTDQYFWPHIHLKLLFGDVVNRVP